MNLTMLHPRFYRNDSVSLDDLIENENCDGSTPEHPILGSAGAALGAGEGQLELERKDSFCSSSSIVKM